MDATNPVKAARTSLGLTIDALADKADVNRQVIIRTEQGLYDRIPPKVLTTLHNLRPDEPDIIEAYGEWQSSLRRRNFGVLITPFPIPDYGVHPFINWRESSNINSNIAFCKLYCVHHAIVHKFESKPEEVTAVPVPILTALRESGYTFDLGALIEYYSRYRDHLLDKARRVQAVNLTPAQVQVNPDLRAAL